MTLSVVALAWLTSCAPAPQSPTAPPLPPAESEAEAATTPEPVDTMKPLPPTDVRAMTCAMLLSTGDDDKAYASTFLLGYRSALMHTHIIDIKKIEAVEEAALAQCATTPTAVASKVFAVAFAKIERAERVEKASTAPAMQFRRRQVMPSPTAAAPASPDQGQPAPTSQEPPASEPAPDQSQK
jgi:hypothetical protein